jgi:prepilin-type N-terminal cleavage/methylation domain-containing protein
MGDIRRRGFTLVELMVVVIIVGILAAVAVPMLSASKDRAIASEALAVIGAVNGAGRLYMVEVTGADPSGFTDLDHLSDTGLISIADLGGTYFENDEYDDWAFDSVGKVTHVNAGSYSVTWVAERMAYMVTEISAED